MKGQKIESTQIDQYIREVVRKEHPKTVESLIRIVQQKYNLPEQEIMDIIFHARLRFTNQLTSVSSGLKRYLATANARWYWFIITLCMLTAIVVLVLPRINPVVYARILLGSVFVFWMPGYCVIKSLFPKKELEKLELVALSWGTSIVLVPLMALVLHYTPWGIKTEAVTMVLLMLTLALSTLAIVREHRFLFIRQLRTRQPNFEVR